MSSEIEIYFIVPEKEDADSVYFESMYDFLEKKDKIDTHGYASDIYEALMCKGGYFIANFVEINKISNIDRPGVVLACKKKFFEEIILNMPKYASVLMMRE